MTHQVLIAASLALAVSLCWIGTLGAWRMREPIQALHYLSLPTASAAILVVIAVFVQTGWSPATLKTALICIVLVATNSVGTHATARAIRVRKLGHWEPRKEDGVEFIPGERKA
ncbi:MAG: cation:proton antiporter [Terracidiphilus sp.]